MFGMIRLLVLNDRWQLEARAALMLRPVSVCITECIPLKLQLKIIVAATRLFTFHRPGRCSPDVGVVFVMLVFSAAGENSYCSTTAELSGTYYPEFPGSEPA